MRLFITFALLLAGFTAGRLTAPAEPGGSVTVVVADRVHLDSLCAQQHAAASQSRGHLDAEIAATADELNPRHFDHATQDCVANAGGL